MTRLMKTHPITAKTITYALMHFTVAVAYALTGSWVLALSIGTIEPLVQTLAYTLHERGWGAFLAPKKVLYPSGS